MNRLSHAIRIIGAVAFATTTLFAGATQSHAGTTPERARGSQVGCGLQLLQPTAPIGSPLWIVQEAEWLAAFTAGETVCD